MSLMKLISASQNTKLRLGKFSVVVPHTLAVDELSISVSTTCLAFQLNPFLHLLIIQFTAREIYATGIKQTTHHTSTTEIMRRRVQFMTLLP
jgi:hypothetical protein